MDLNKIFWSILPCIYTSQMIVVSKIQLVFTQLTKFAHILWVCLCKFLYAYVC